MRVFLCDDKKEELELYTKKLEELAKKYEQNLELKQFSSGEELLFYLEGTSQRADAIYLDINMPNYTGIRVAEKMQEAEFGGEIIFLTVSKQHFIPAFDVGAFNYIIKGETTDERFEEVFRKIMNLIDEKQTEYILLTGGGEHRKIELSSIHYFEIQRRIVTAHYKDKEFEFFSTMEKLENQLYNKGFVRVHRAYLVATAAIAVASYDNLKLRNGDEVPIGRTYQKQTQEYLKKNL